jgi:hypothetical protein
MHRHLPKRETGGSLNGGKTGQYGTYYYFLTAIGLTPGGSSTVHIYTQTEHRELTIHNNKKIKNT